MFSSDQIFELRICPGEYLADASIWMVFATMLSTITISKAKDENGQEITPEIAFEVALSAYVMMCHCHAEPRLLTLSISPPCCWRIIANPRASSV